LIGQLNPYAVLILNGKVVQVSKKLKRTNNPIWPDATKELLITDRKKAKLALVIKDDRDLAQDPVLGTYQIKLDDMLELTFKGQEWYNLVQTKTGRAKITLQWKPVELKGALGGSGGYVKPIGVMRLPFQNARQLRNLETMSKCDPYARVLLSGIEKGRTVTWKNNLNPDWDEIVYVPVYSTREKLMIEVMDQENFGKDRSLGHVELAAADYIKQGEGSSEYLVKAPRQISQGLVLGNQRQPRGTINFSAAFYPTLSVADPDDEESAEAGASTEAGADGVPEKRDRSRSGTISSLRTNGTGDIDIAKKPAQGENEQSETKDVAVTKPPKIKLSADSLMEYESGLLVFKFIDGHFAQTGCYLEVVMDDYVFPSWSSSKVNSRQHTFNESEWPNNEPNSINANVRQPAMRLCADWTFPRSRFGL